MANLVAPPLAVPPVVNAPANESPDGLTSEEARRRLDQGRSQLHARHLIASGSKRP